jgi:hypothetical protein
LEASDGLLPADTDCRVVESAADKAGKRLICPTTKSKIMLTAVGHNISELFMAKKNPGCLNVERQARDYNLARS